MQTSERAAKSPIKISAVILARNEERLIERCLRSVHGVVDEILVIDSCSTDRTCDIAQQFGARVVQQSWLGWIAQRALGIGLAAHDWVLILEADEIVTPQLASAIRAASSEPMNVDNGYSVDRRDDFLGALLPRMRRRSKRLHFTRLFNRTRSQYDPTLIVHDEVRSPGHIIPLAGVLIHWRGFTIADQVARYSTYAPLEAEVMLTRGRRVHVVSLLVRPALRFGWCYLVCGGFRLGGRGFAHALMVASSEYLRYATAWEQQSVSDITRVPEHVARAFAIESVLTSAPITHVVPTSVALPIRQATSRNLQTEQS